MRSAPPHDVLVLIKLGTIEMAVSGLSGRGGATVTATRGLQGFRILQSMVHGVFQLGFIATPRPEPRNGHARSVAEPDAAHSTSPVEDFRQKSWRCLLRGPLSIITWSTTLGLAADPPWTLNLPLN